MKKILWQGLGLVFVFCLVVVMTTGPNTDLASVVIASAIMALMVSWGIIAPIILIGLIAIVVVGGIGLLTGSFGNQDDGFPIYSRWPDS